MYAVGNLQAFLAGTTGRTAGSFPTTCYCEMEMKTTKTNAARLLDKAKIAYELIPYQVDESDLSAIHVAVQLGEPIDRVFILIATPNEVKSNGM